MIDSGNTAWVLVSTALVLLMTPGLAFFYGGLVRSSQVLNTIKMSFVSLGVGSVLWALLGYSLAFGSGNCLIGGFEWLGLQGVGATPNPDYGETVPHLGFVVFQMMFAVITPAIISGAVVGRMRFKAYTLFIALWMLVVYAPLAHWVWGPQGWIADLGAIDFAGGTVVHVSAGVAALVAAGFVGRRQQPSEGEAAHNVPLVVLGAALLWFGWFGFNAGSALAADGIAALAVITTMLGAAAAVATWMVLDMWHLGKPSITGAAIGAVVGLVAITPGAGFVSPLAAVCIGALASVASYVAIAMMRSTRVDDALDVFACHGIGGAVGALLTGVFATKAANPDGADGLLTGNFDLMLAQGVSVVAAAAFAAAGTALVLVVTRAVTPLRVDDDVELAGIDVFEHNERAYSPTWFEAVEATAPAPGRTASDDDLPSTAYFD
ncbi:MAG: ammonium transporter [Planctomycetes bacterium]|nr:ammonium transporter [Planctomycetota bacterium]